MEVFEFRSDTFTQPTGAMRDAMRDAIVGDDAWGNDPTVKELEAEAASIMGKESGVFVLSGTMGNLTSILSHTDKCGRGTEVIMGNKCHVLKYEGGGIAALGGCVVRTVPNQPDGSMHCDDVEASINSRTSLILTENTHCSLGGRVVSLSSLHSVLDLARSKGIPVHLDGARVFNAAAALKCSPSEVAATADSITFCLSKSLSAPGGSVVCGSVSFCASVRRYRHMLGGGMHQGGILAAAGLVALREMISRPGIDNSIAKVMSRM